MTRAPRASPPRLPSPASPQVGAVPVRRPSASRASSPAVGTPGSRRQRRQEIAHVRSRYRAAPSTPLTGSSPARSARISCRPRDRCELPTSMQRWVTTLTDMTETHVRSPVFATHRPPISPRTPTRPRRSLRRGRGGPAGVLGQAGQPAGLGHAVHRGAGLVGRAVRQVVRRRQAQRRLQLRGPPCRGRQRRSGRHPLGGRTRRRRARPHLRRAQGRGLQGRQRVDRAWPGRRRPGRDLHADGARGHRGDAGLRAAGRHAQRGVRRLLRARRCGPASRTPRPSW